MGQEACSLGAKALPNGDDRKHTRGANAETLACEEVPTTIYGVTRLFPVPNNSSLWLYAKSTLVAIVDNIATNTLARHNYHALRCNW